MASSDLLSITPRLWPAIQSAWSFFANFPVARLGSADCGTSRSRAPIDLKALRTCHLGRRPQAGFPFQKIPIGIVIQAGLFLEDVDTGKRAHAPCLSAMIALNSWIAAEARRM